MSCFLKLFKRKNDEYDWVEPKYQYLNKTTLDEKRELYQCGKDFKTIDEVKRWGLGCQFAPQGDQLRRLRTRFNLWTPHFPEFVRGTQERDTFNADPCLNNKIGIFIGTIHNLEVDAVVIPCNQYFSSGVVMGQRIPPPSGNVFNHTKIHEAAGPYLKRECDHLKVCPNGQATVTGGYKLPAKYVIHTNAPTLEFPGDVETCYINSLRVAIEENIKTIAFPCISTGDEDMQGFPTEQVTPKVLRGVRHFLEENPSHFELIVFCLIDERDIINYQDCLPHFFPF